MKLKSKKQIIIVGVSVVAIVSLCLVLANAYLFDDQLKVETVDKSEKPINKPLAVKAKQVKQSSTPQELDEPEDEFITEDLSEKLSEVATAYEEQARYPVNSRLVTDQDLARSPEPFEESKIGGDMLDEDGGLSPIGLSAAVDKMQYFVGDVITLQLLVSGTDENASVSASANILAPASGLLYPSNIELSTYGNNANEYRTTFNTAAFSLANPSNELLAKIEVKIDDESFVTTVPFLFSSASARLENVSQSRPEGASLVIPLEYSVFESGYYFAHAYLDDATTGQTLLSLQAEGRMQQGNDRLVLKAHQQALKDAGSEGPYQLRVIKSFRGAEPGQGEDVSTAISQRSYSLPAMAFENYDDTQHSDPEVEEILEELQDLSNGNDDERE